MEFLALGLVVLFPLSVWYAARRLRVCGARERVWWLAAVLISVGAFFVGLVGLRGHGDALRGAIWTVAVFCDLTIGFVLFRALRERDG